MSDEGKKSPRGGINLSALRDTMKRVLKSPRGGRTSKDSSPAPGRMSSASTEVPVGVPQLSISEPVTSAPPPNSDPIENGMLSPRSLAKGDDGDSGGGQSTSTTPNRSPRSSPRRRKKSVRGRRSMKNRAGAREKDLIVITCVDEGVSTDNPDVQRIFDSLDSVSKCKREEVAQSFQAMLDTGGALEKSLKERVSPQRQRLSEDVASSILALRHVASFSPSPFSQRSLISCGAEMALAAVAFLESEEEEEEGPLHDRLCTAVDTHMACVNKVRAQSELSQLSSDLKRKGSDPKAASKPSRAVLELCVDATESCGRRVLDFLAEQRNCDFKLFGQSLKELKASCDALAQHMGTEALASTLQWRGQEAINSGVSVIKARLGDVQPEELLVLMSGCSAEVSKLLEYVRDHVEVGPVFASSPVDSTPPASLAASPSGASSSPPVPKFSLGSPETSTTAPERSEDPADLLSPRSRSRAKTVLDSLQKKARMIRRMNRHSMEIGAALVGQLHLEAAPQSEKLLGVSVEGLLCDRGNKVPRFFVKLVEWVLAHNLGAGDHQADPERTNALVESMEAGHAIPEQEHPSVVLSVLRRYFERAPQILCASEEEALEELDASQCPDKRYRIIGYHCVLYRLPALRREVLFFLLNKYALPLCRRGDVEIGKFCDSWADLLLWMSPRASACLHFLMTNMELIRDPSKTMGGASWVWLSGRHVLQCASFETIVEMLLHSSYSGNDHNFCEIVLMTHTMFCRSKDVLEALLNAYDKHRGTSDDENAAWNEKRRHNVLAVVGFWFMRPNYLLPDQVTRDFVSTWQEYVGRLIRMKNLTSHEKNSFKKYTKVLSGQYAILEKSAEERLQLLKHPLGSNRITFQGLLAMDPGVVAGTMTNVDRFLFKLIPPYELFGKNHTIPEKSPSFTRMIAQFNRVSLWAAFEIVNITNRPDRVEMLNYLISVCYRLFVLKNFHACYAMICGMNYASISRLVKTWKKVGKAEMKQYQELMVMFDMSRNHRNYRGHLRLVSPPMIPHIGLVSRDLFSISENNQDVVNGLINVEKLRMLEKNIADLLRMQDVPFPDLPLDPNLQTFFKSLPEIDEKLIYAKSLECEPRATE